MPAWMSAEEEGSRMKQGDSRLTWLYQQIEERVRALPGVRAASYSSFTFNEGSWNNPVSVQGYVSADSHRDVHHNVVGTDYFAAMGIPLLAGRGFGPQDTSTSKRVAVISETMARTMFPPGSPLGYYYSRGSDKDIRSDRGGERRKSEQPARNASASRLLSLPPASAVFE